MALTATAQSALPPPSWDEAIVPSLRKRLQNESRMLSKRLSSASASDEDVSNYSANYRTIASTSYTNSRPNTSASSSHASPRSAQPHSNGVKAPPGKRPRTNSQPFPAEPPAPIASSRSNSPMVDRADARPSRIPVSRGRSPSLSSQSPSQLKATGHLRNGVKESSADLYAVREKPPSPQLVSIPLRHQNSRIINEPAPYYASDSDDAPRPSVESEERPFEHWYRGDTARNGGVGELRVGRRMEMLAIAQHGHSLRSQQFAAHTRAPESRATSRASGAAAGRRRADSLGARESFYLDDPSLGSVLDEQPLTEGEDGDTDAEAMMDRTNHQRNEDSDSRIPRPSRSATPTSMRPINGRATTSPVTPQLSAARAGSEPPFASPVPAPSPVVAASPSTPSRPSPPPQQQRSRSQPRLLNTPPVTPASKRGASPVSPRAAGKKPKTVAQRRVPRDEENRRSVGSYPDVEDDGDSSLADAIPKWTQPKLTNGNWDDVVLPAVAKKKGLEGHYEQADGSPKVVQRRQSTLYEPAPGTFGYDHTKYRRGHPEHIPMDEFGQMPAPEPEPTYEDDEKRPHRVDEYPDDRPIKPKTERPQHLDAPPPVSPPSHRSTSPAPFSHYQGSREDLSAPGGQQRPVPVDEPDASSGGCCKCVVM